MVARGLRASPDLVAFGGRLRRVGQLVALLVTGVAEISNVAANRAFCTGNRCFNGMAWESRRHQAQATWAHDLRPIRLMRLPGLFLFEALPMRWHTLHGSECRLQSAGSKCAPSRRAGFCAMGRTGGWGAKRSGALCRLLVKKPDNCEG